MIAVALFFDVLQALLDLIGIGWILVFLSYPTFWLWFKIHGINFFSAKRAKTIGLNLVGEGLTAGIWVGMTWTVVRIALDYKIKETASESVGRVVGSIRPKSADNDREMKKAA